MIYLPLTKKEHLETDARNSEKYSKWRLTPGTVTLYCTGAQAPNPKV